MKKISYPSEETFLSDLTNLSIDNLKNLFFRFGGKLVKLVWHLNV